MMSERFWKFSVCLMLAAGASGCGDRQTPEAATTKPPGTVEPAAEAGPDEPRSVVSNHEGTRGSLHFLSMREGSGIDFVHVSGNSPEKNFPAANGSGLGTFDFDLDGWPDLYFGCGSLFPIPPAESRISDRLYRNRASWRFQDTTELAGLGHTGYSVGIACGDCNSDGFPDLFVAGIGSDQLFLNLGDGTFAEVSAQSGAADPRWATSAAFVDFNNDGHLDIYVCNYGHWSMETNKFCGDPERNIRMFCNPTMVEPDHDGLWENLADGTFQDAADRMGLHARCARGQGVLAADINLDHQVDLYVANDIQPNFLLLGNGQAPFTEVGELSGTAYSSLGQAQAGMGLAIGDMDRNGQLDLFVTNYQNEPNALYENFGGGVFMDVGTTRIPEGSLPYVGWGTSFSDFDLDGWLDLIVTNGHTDDNLADLGKEGEYLQPPGLWKNTAGQFELARAGAGDYFETLHNGRGLTTSDLDNDGDTDVVVMHQDNSPELLQNDSLRAEGHAPLQILLVGTVSNRDAIGSLIEIEGAEPPLLQPVFGGGSYASAIDRTVTLGVHSAETVTAKVHWPDGSVTASSELKPGNSYIILQSARANELPRVYLRSHL